MMAFLRRRVLDPIVALLRQGVTPDKIALSVAFGAVLGVFPVLGTTTVLCTLAALVWRLNLAAVHAVHFALTPVQLLLIIPFVRIGEGVLEHPPQPLSISAGLEILAQGATQAIVVLWDAILHAMLGWLVVGPVAIFVLYRALVPAFGRAARRFTREAVA